jgi:hypothetical protein
MRPDELFVHVRSRKFNCVLDPALVLGSHLGLAFAVRLSRVLEPWLTRSFWRMIDSSELIMPELSTAAPSEPDSMLRPLAGTLRAWIVLRDSTDAGSWPFRWVGDNVALSQFQGVADAGLVTRYEALAEAMSCSAPEDHIASDPWSRVWNHAESSLDTIALSAALGGALVLTASTAGQEPWPVKAMARIGHPARLLDPLPSERPASLFASERELLRDALVTAELASMVQELPELAVLHVSVASSMTALDPTELIASCAWGLDPEQRGAALDLCNEVQGWWYYL